MADDGCRIARPQRRSPPPLMKPSIEVEGLSKTYRIYGNPWGPLFEKLPWNKKPWHKAVHALHDINFKVEPSQCVGLIGSNGAGKSTLLKILSGTTFPTTGRLTVRGRVASLLELGAGFHQSFSGRENIMMNAAMMGFSRKQAKKKVDEIIEFSELGDFINAPIRTYSSGMGARLGFSVAIAVDPDILIIDEILAVGDMNFRRKCVDKIWNFKRAGKALFFCSHSLYDVRQLCDQAIWMKDGKMQMMGDSILVTNEYSTYENNVAGAAEKDPFAALPVADKYDENDHPRILGAVLIDPATGQKRNKFSPGEKAALRVHVRNSVRKPESLALAVGAIRGDSTMVWAQSTQLDGLTFDFAEGYVTLHLDKIRLLSGEFTLPIWLLDKHGVHRFHERPAEQNLIVQNRTKDLGLYLEEHHWTIDPIRKAAEPGLTKAK
jgi:ABC-type polysaccharide/polyol phosphate transport system ATPase subunit